MFLHWLPMKPTYFNGTSSKDLLTAPLLKAGSHLDLLDELLLVKEDDFHMEGLDDCPAAHLEALLHAPHPRSLLIPHLAHLNHLAHHQLRSLHGAGVGRRLGRSGENCTYNVGRRGWSSYLPLPSPTAPRSIPAPEIGFLKEWSSVYPIIWRYLQCLRETGSGSCCLYHPCPPSTPATGVNWARKPSRNIGPTFIARMQLPCPHITRHGHQSTLCFR